MASGEPITDGYVLGLIATTLTSIHATKAFSHYPSLRIQTQNLNSALETTNGSLAEFLEWLSATLLENADVAPAARLPEGPQFHFRTIAPTIIRHFLAIARSLAANTKPAPKMSAQELTRGATASGSFTDFCELTTAVRQFVDLAVETGYHLCRTEAATLNFRVLESMVSFLAIAPNSLNTLPWSDRLQAVLADFEGMTVAEKRACPYARNSNGQFPQKVSAILESVGEQDGQKLSRNISHVFKFCSEFLHVGYIPMLVTERSPSGPIMGVEDDAFLARSENFAELKLLLLREASLCYCKMLLGGLHVFADRLLDPSAAEAARRRLSEMGRRLLSAIESTDRKLLQPVRRGIKGSSRTIEFACLCGGQVRWRPPHQEWFNYCGECGARFQVYEVAEDVEYVIASGGPCDVAGGAAPKIMNLSPKLRAKLTRVWELHRPPPDHDGAVSYMEIRDLAGLDPETLSRWVRIVDGPSPEDRALCRIFAFVSEEALKRRGSVAIRCNCGYVSSFSRGSRCFISCPACHTGIGILAVEGAARYITGQNPDGSPQQFPVFGSD